MALRHWLQLALTEGIGPILTGRLIDATGGAEGACAATRELLGSIEGIGPNKSRSIYESLKRAAGEVDGEIARCQSAGVKMICQEDADYPELLKVIPDPPPLLYVRGTLEPRDLNGVGIVGSRRCSHYGREQAERFGALLAQAGVTVISGGARGVDSASHRGAMAPPDGRTIAVLGCGVDIAYPPENQALFAQIAQRGAVISEFPLSSPPMKENFPRRNRIISGMSRGVLVVEADIASGALITARQAGDDHGRPVFALPGRVDNPMSAGPHYLIREGATLVTNLEDILDGLGPLPHGAMIETPAASEDLFADSEPPEANSPPKEKLPEISLTDRQKQILQGITENPTNLDTIINACDLPAEIVMQELTMLTLRGVVKRLDGQTYVRKIH
jgi:DNA processing protein